MSDQDKCEGDSASTGSTVSYSASYGASANSGAGSNYSVNAQGAVTGVSVGAGYPAYGSTYTAGYTKTEETVKRSQSNSPALPDIVFMGEGPNREQIRIVYAPEQDISARDALKLATLLHLKATDRMYEFGIYQYIRQHHLERHFKMELY